MKVLYISYDGMTDPLGQSQVIPYLQGLSELGHEVILISCEKKARFEKLYSKISELLRLSGINWHPVSYSPLSSILSKQLNLRLIEKKSREICLEEKPYAVHCRSYMAALIGLKLKRKYGLKFIFDMRGFWADERIDGQIWSRSNPIHNLLYKYFKKKELEFISNADFTISLTENAKSEILSWDVFRKKPVNIAVIPCCADLEHFSAKKENKEADPNRDTLGFKASDLVISYLGSIGTWYMLDEMLDFFKCLSAEKPNARFLFITPDDAGHILEKARRKNIQAANIRVVEASRDLVPYYLGLSQISLYFIKPLYSKKASSPTKTGEILSMGIPIITNSGIGDSDRILSESGTGLLVREFTELEYTRIIRQIDVFLGTDKTKFVNAAEKHFSLENGVRLYDSVYNSI
ncbi:MAG TPA: glycosyltransferase [Bacteroidia bacterium]|jgi:glycosyltransferase involved in cell wall biosynthesis